MLKRISGRNNAMKHFLALALALLSAHPATAQNIGTPMSQVLVNPSAGNPDYKPFDLDFQGGTPLELVKAIEKALGTNVNVLIPAELADRQMPAFRVNQVNLLQLMAGIAEYGRQMVTMSSYKPDGSASLVSHQVTRFGFTPVNADRNPGTRSLFRLYAIDAPRYLDPPKSCKFFQLAPYLQNNLRVEDITTAITTGWDLMGLKQQPQIQYHKETKMLIAFGEAAHLEVITSVLKELQPPSEKVPPLKPSAPPEKK